MLHRNLRKLLLVLITVISAVKSNAQEATTPKIVFEETVFDFDTLIQNGDGTHNFWFTNQGNAPLNITSAFTSCGCIVPSWPKEPVMPKQKGCIEVKYNTSIVGHFQKAIIVKSNDPNNPKAVIRMSGTVIEPPKEKQK